MKIRAINVLPKLPKALEPLREIAYNVWFSWNWEAVQLFIRLDPEYWEKTYQNPTLMLGIIPQERFEELARDEGFLATMNRAYARFRAYVEAPTWFSKTYPDAKDRIIAYFSTEFGIDVGIPIYSGGLGVLAGDHLKSASDLGLPLVAVGLLYREGYLKQYLMADGWQQERYPRNDWDNMPVTLVADSAGKPLIGQVELDGAPVQFRVWRIRVGRVSLFLLDTDMPENAPEQRSITTRLYAGDRDMRLRQEILLGIGGMRALDMMGIQPAVCHMNEGHSAFMAIERLRQIMDKYNLSRAEAHEIVWATTVFTTHTPVPAGNERFDPNLLARYLSNYVKKIGISLDEFLAMGRENPRNKDEEFCLTVLALLNAAHCNAVSVKHGRVSRILWRNLWPDLPPDDVPIGSITNGIHTRSWLSHDMAELLDRYLGPRFLEEPMDFTVWKRIENIPDVELWRTHERRRERLVWFIRKRISEQNLRRRGGPQFIDEAEQLFDPEVLTLGFARRFAEYKRGTLIFRDTDRLKKILNDPKRPVQLVISGKAHPMDMPGKQLIKDIIHLVRADGFRNRVVFVEDYDINVARYMVQGVDVWLNLPRPPLEASGTSGMKAAANGALTISTYDGWWCEGYSPEVGWTIGRGETYDSFDVQDQLESSALYEILEQEVVPLFYEKGGEGIPKRWIERMKRSMNTIGAYFNSNRMTSDYLNNFYLDAGRRYVALTGDGQNRAKSLAAWRARLRQNWSGVCIEDAGSSTTLLTVGDQLEVTARVRLGNLRPDEIQVQLCVGGMGSEEQLEDTTATRMTPDENPSGGVYTYRCKIICARSGRRGYSVRVLPFHPDLVHPFDPGMVVWG